MQDRVYAWNDIADGFEDGLILGNGASIALDERFRYTSLKAKAEESGLISEDVRRVFRHLRTADFELVLRMLWHASEVNRALGINDQRTADAYSSVREALIRVVRAIHPPYGDIADRLIQAAEFMQRFRTVASLNYDLIVYWAILLCNEKTPHRFKDCFIRGEFERDWQWMRKPFGKGQQTTLVVYPHGNLALVTSIDGKEQKVHKTEDADLLETVFARWLHGEAVPLFVSEGTADQKRAAIGRSPYLSTVYHDILGDISESVVIVGWSLSDNDGHILEALLRSSVQQFAVAVDPHAKNLEETCVGVRSKLRRERRGPPVVFFDRSSAGCWVSKP